jgi:hypothetical protein
LANHLNDSQSLSFYPTVFILENHSALAVAGLTRCCLAVVVGHICWPVDLSIVCRIGI